MGSLILTLIIFKIPPSVFQITGKYKEWIIFLRFFTILLFALMFLLYLTENQITVESFSFRIDRFKFIFRKFFRELMNKVFVFTVFEFIIRILIKIILL